MLKINEKALNMIALADKFEINKTEEGWKVEIKMFDSDYPHVAFIDQYGIDYYIRRGCEAFQVDVNAMLKLKEFCEAMVEEDDG